MGSIGVSGRRVVGLGDTEGMVECEGRSNGRVIGELVGIMELKGDEDIVGADVFIALLDFSFFLFNLVLFSAIVCASG
jgi:hypothetical protein